MNAPASDLPLRTQASPALHMLLRLRWLSVCAQLAVIAFVHFALGMTLPLPMLALVIAALAAWNALSVLAQGQFPATPASSLLVQLLVDTAALTLLLYFTGGPGNPFISLYLVQIALAALILRARGAWLVTAVCVLAYTLLMRWHWPLPMAIHAGGSFGLHIWGMWVNFLLSTAIIIVFVITLLRRLRARDEELAKLHRARLRDEQLLAAGTMAAGTAHALGTPLNTIALGIEALRSGELDAEEAKEELEVLQQQVDHCRQALDALRDRSRDTPSVIDARDFLDQCIEDWRLLNPQVTLNTRLVLDAPAAILADITLSHAIGNLLDNAVRASQENRVAQIELAMHLRGDMLEIDIDDHGPGLPQAVVEAGRRGDRKGLGLLLSHASIERMGGEVSVAARADGHTGSRTRIRLPLAEPSR